MSSTIETQAAQEVAVALPAATEEKFRDIDHKIAEVADEETDRQAHLGVDQVLTPEEIDKERKFLRKIDWHIVPLLMITYGVQVSVHTCEVADSKYSDKVALSSGVAFDLTANAGLVGNDFAWLSTGFYLAYMIFEFPFAWILHRLPLDRVLAYTVIGWGICVMCMAACSNFEQRRFNEHQRG
jgi:ACS family allantoate permease-like MFS transporter